MLYGVRCVVCGCLFIMSNLCFCGCVPSVAAAAAVAVVVGWCSSKTLKLSTGETKSLSCDVIVLCTGYRQEFPFLPKDVTAPLPMVRNVVVLTFWFF